MSALADVSELFDGSSTARAAATLCHGAWPQARRAARLAARSPLPGLDVDLAEAVGHTLAEPLAALTDLPAFDTSAMDGWAVAGPGPWHTSGRILAGEPSGPVAGGGKSSEGGRASGVLADGEAVEIATGAPVPAGTTGVLRREHGRIDRGLLHPLCNVAPGQDIRPRGQECRRDEPLLPAGTPVTPAVLGLAAAAGHDRLTVHRRPTVELLLLGDELLDSGIPQGSLIRDALGPLLPPWLAAAGAELIGRRQIGDDFGLLRDAVRLSPADVVITTGGTAGGPVDFLHAALEVAGARLLVDGVAVRPGHPMLLAQLPGGRHLVGLPGNPLAAVAGTVTLALPLLHALSGRPAAAPRLAVAAVDLPGHPADTRLLPVARTEQGVVPLVFDGPAMLRGLALAEALAVIPPGGAPAGDGVELLETP
ncbi:molybdopterin molybdotransferase MoeA [Kitasatospora sp. GP82]|uniref:molybdopterin molybdotransferase MoeA n=1 Tax=Kitasatospora sp. GP82 TaxID=3035089 RepID=UPI002476516A|nr:molybdopterin molybdotransferase MoeA [Kitasatospora sp. GP82]MDH6123725.1 molybdopterin molybdotransferase [Kitasatospora sp. GP82]